MHNKHSPSSSTRTPHCPRNGTVRSTAMRRSSTQPSALTSPIAPPDGYTPMHAGSTKCVMAPSLSAIQSGAASSGATAPRQLPRGAFTYSEYVRVQPRLSAWGAELSKNVTGWRPSEPPRRARFGTSPCPAAGTPGSDRCEHAPRTRAGRSLVRRIRSGSTCTRCAAASHSPRRCQRYVPRAHRERRTLRQSKLYSACGIEGLQRAPGRRFRRSHRTPEPAAVGPVQAEGVRPTVCKKGTCRCTVRPPSPTTGGAWRENTPPRTRPC